MTESSVILLSHKIWYNIFCERYLLRLKKKCRDIRFQQQKLRSRAFLAQIYCPSNGAHIQRKCIVFSFQIFESFDSFEIENKM